MRPIRLLHAISACIFASLIASAQSPDALNFRIVDEADEPVSYAVVVAVNEQDSITSAPVFSSESGEVSLMLGDAHYTALKVQCMGYVTATVGLPLTSHTIVLERDPNMLGEVVVKSGPALQQKNGKFIFNPSELYNRSTDAYSVLQYTPLIEVDDAKISILGTGNSKIYINGKDPNMDTPSIIIMLKALSPNQIKKIEIITSPGASQSASLSGGIVNVILDKPYEGYLGAISGNLKYSYDRFSPNLSFYNAYTGGKFRMAAILYYQNPNSHKASTTTYNYADVNRIVTNSSSNTSHYNFAGAGVMLGYEFTPKSNLNLSIKAAGGKTRENSFVESDELFDGDEPTHSTTRITTISPFLRPDYDVTASYNLKLDKIKGELDIITSFTSRKDPVNTDYLYGSSNPISQYTDIKSNGFHFKPTYKQKFGAAHTIQAGYDLLRSNIDNEFQYPGQDNRFKYTEMINSTFVNWSASWTEAFYTSLGLRMENTDITTRQTVDNERSSRNYTDVFPNLYASIKLPGGGNQSISFSVSRNISRPYYNYLNPFVYWTSPTTYRRGNTELRPQYSWRYGVYYSFLRSFILNFFLSHSNDSRREYVYMDSNGNTVSSIGNFGNSIYLSGSLSYNKALTKFWYLKSSISAYYTSENANIGDNDIGYRNTSFSFQATNNFTLSQRHSCHLDVSYTLKSPSESLIGKTKYNNYLSIEFKKRFRCGLSLSVRADNILDSRRTANLYTPAYSYVENLKFNHRQYALSIQYIFGKTSIKTVRERDDSTITSRFQ